MPQAAGIEVTRDADGTVRVGGEPACPAFTRAVLDVAGAVLTWPVLDEPAPPAAEIHDPERAQQWLWAVHGERVAAAVHDRAAGGPDGVRVAYGATALAGGAARLALGHWAARWWPASYADGIPALEPDVLGLELAALTHQCQQLFDTAFDDQPDDCVAELIEEHQAALDPLLQWWRATPGPTGTGRHLDGVLRLLDDAADSAGMDGPALRRLRSALDRRPPAGAPLDLGALFARPRDYALAAGGPPAAGGRVIARGSGNNDWLRYPPGLVDAAEDAVSWTARAVGARRRIEVEVVADAAAPVAGAPLVAEVRVNGGRAHRVPLARRDDLWTGLADLRLDADTDLDADRELERGLPAMPPRIEVGVLLPGFDPGTGAPGDAVHRDAVRALARQRLAAARPSPYDTHDIHDAYDSHSGPFLAEIAAAATEEDF
ncbi:hypothetical protein NMG29_09755 [Streptomyces cocklensis]|nr:hypothetical protein [Actinacidiphila cocklensis]MDD1058499.1 hypothetical protein [Actinacidiphila cocklensis]